LDEDGQDATLVGRTKQSDIYVYRMTMTNEDGEVVEYTPDFMRYRCELMGVKTVPVWTRFTIPHSTGDIYVDRNENDKLDDGEIAYSAPINAGEYVLKEAEHFYDGPDPIGKTHVREGVVVRILNRPTFAAYKHKNFHFKVLEGIIKDTAEAPDMEEAQEV
jgi:outer membrane protein assembly factor BamB